MKSLAFFISLLLFTTSFHAKCQEEINIEGKWSGIVTAPLAKDFTGEFHFHQNKGLISGWYKLVTVDKSDSMKVNFSGTIKKAKVLFRGNEFVYQSPMACFSIMELAYDEDQGIQKLAGRWRGNMELTTCPPGVSGAIKLEKVPETSQPLQTAFGRGLQEESAVVKENISTIAEEDFYGNGILEELEKRKYYALLIGIDEYEDEFIIDLDHPTSDAKRFQDILFRDYGFQDKNTIALQNPTRASIIDAFDLLAKQVSSRDQLLIFYAGHGIWDENLKQGYWLPSNASKASKAEWLSNSTIRDYINGINSKHTLLITDACFSGSIFKERSVNFANSKAILEMYKLPSRKAMTSGTLKTVPDESVFIKYLLKNLETNSSPLLSAHELFGRFKIAVINNSVNGQVPQYGAIGQAGDEGGEFIFYKTR